MSSGSSLVVPPAHCDLAVPEAVCCAQYAPVSVVTKLVPLAERLNVALASSDEYSEPEGMT